MTLSTSDVARLAQLARLRIEPAEAEKTLADLNAVFALIGRMQALDTSGVEPMAHAQDMIGTHAGVGDPGLQEGLQKGLRLRADVVTESDQRDALQALAPLAQDGLYLVPRVIE